MKFILNKDSLEIENKQRINSGSVNYYEVDVEYDASWRDLTIECVIVNKENNIGTSIGAINKKVFIDSKLNGPYNIGFVGYSIEDGKKTYQISTNLKSINFYAGAGEIKTQAKDLPTLTEWEIYIAQIEEMIANIKNGGETGGIAEETDPTVPEYIKNITEQDIEKWNGVDEALKDKASINDMITYIEEHKEELKGADGKDGVDGTNGKDGYTPIKGVDYFDGKDGEKGEQGEKGTDGKTPVKGTDYYTEADKQEMINSVIEALPKYNGGVS